MQYFSQGTGLIIWALVVTAGSVFVGLFFYFTAKRPWTGQALVPTVLMEIALIFLAITYDFPGEAAGPALIPRLWILCLAILCSALLFLTVRGKAAKDPKVGRIGFVLLGIVCMVAYYFAIQFLGYFLSSALFLPAMMYLLSCRKPLLLILVTTGWLTFSYLIFYRLLYIQLPLGFFENYL